MTTYHYHCTSNLKPSINICTCNVIIAFHYQCSKATLLTFVFHNIFFYHYPMLFLACNFAFILTFAQFVNSQLCSFTFLLVHMSINLGSSIIFLVIHSPTLLLTLIEFWGEKNFTTKYLVV
jgi:hypothetical protein